MHPSWEAALAPVGATIDRLMDRAQAARIQGEAVVPSQDRILAAFDTPLDEVRAIILGQDPYPSPGHAIGLAFAVEPGVRPKPPSLRNILTEWSADLGRPIPDSPDLLLWQHEGVLLLNTTLTTMERTPGAHASWGWQEVTSAAIRAVAESGQTAVGVLWGASAKALDPHFGALPTISSVHPSPLSARKGFFGSRPFSSVNRLLELHGSAPLTWRLTPDG